MAFDGLRVLSLESRRAAEMEILIRKQGGEPFVAPSMREVALKEHGEVIQFGRKLLDGDFDCVILLTGIGTRLLWKFLLNEYEEEALKHALKRLTIIVRGPKPAAAARELGLTGWVPVPEPNTWREILEVMRERPETRIAVQEYGKSSEELLEGLRAMRKTVIPVRIYAWDLPEDAGPLRQAAAMLIAGKFDVVLFTTSMQLINLLKISEEEGISQQVMEALQSAVVVSIGPTTTETLEEHGLQADFEPSLPRMGLMVNEAAASAARLLAGKR